MHFQTLYDSRIQHKIYLVTFPAFDTASMHYYSANQYSKPIGGLEVKLEISLLCILVLKDYR